MNRIVTLFSQSRLAQQTVFVPFLALGDPDLATSQRRFLDLAERSAALDIPVILEIGFPYSDPIADGAAIQAAYNRALAHGLKLADCWPSLRDLRQQLPTTPMVAMVSYSLIYRQQPTHFLDLLQQIDLDGLIVPDLPNEEASELSRLALDRNLAFIPLLAPTTSPDRQARILQLATGFVYIVSDVGITGEREQLPAQLFERLQKLREQTPLPLCVGFGISKPEHIRPLRGQADGVIIGSALVRHFAALDSAAVESSPATIGKPSEIASPTTATLPAWQPFVDTLLSAFRD